MIELITPETLGVKRWEDLTAEHLEEYRVRGGWSYYEFDEIVGTNRGYLWGIIHGKFPMSDRMKKRLWMALQNPAEAFPYYLRDIAVRTAPRQFDERPRTHAIPWERLRGGKVLTCVGCGVQFVGFRSNTKYHSRNCGKNYRRRIRRQRRELDEQQVPSIDIAIAADA